MVAAYDEFCDKLDGLIKANPENWREKIGKISGFFKKQSKVVAVYAANDADAFTIFETLNDRGRELTIADLLKNYLFSRAKDDIDSVQKNWMDCRAILEEYIEEKEFVTFLRHYWSSVHGSTREKELYKDIKANITSKAQALQFSENIRDAAKLYGAILSDKAEFWKGYRASDRNNVQLMMRLKLEQHRPLMLAILQHLTATEIKKVLPFIISWSVRGLISGIMGKGAAETTFCDAATKIRKGEIKTLAQLRTHFRSFVPTDKQFQNDFEVYRTNNNGLARFLLLGIERGLSGQKQPELVPNDLADELNLEHILPKRAKVAEWPKFEPDEIGFHSLKLGNMTLLKERDNAKLGNRSFATKKPVLAKSKLNLNKTFKQKTKWEQSDIVARQKRLAEAAVKVWKV